MDASKQIPTTPRGWSSERKPPKTPLILDISAAKLFGNDIEAFMTPVVSTFDGLIRDETVDLLYLDQCHSWFTRTTRSRTPRITDITTVNFTSSKGNTTKKKNNKEHGVDNKSNRGNFLAPSSTETRGPKQEDRRTKILNKRRKRSRLSVINEALENEVPFGHPVSSPSILSKVDSADLVGGQLNESLLCLACTTDRISHITSRNIFKLLSNNIGICPVHRLMTHRILDDSKGEDKLDDFWQLEENQVDGDIPFTVNEDRRLKNGVQKRGEGNWDVILSSYIFASSRTTSDLESRWNQLKNLLKSGES